MIEFCNNNQLKPFQLFRTYYGDAIKYGQKNADAISIASFSKNDSILDSRFVNLKILDNEEFIFFSSYDSPKAKQFDTFNQIAANLFWESINVQVRIKGKIKKKSSTFNSLYFTTRDIRKNALSISSNQSNIIETYSQVVKNYKNALETSELHKCPNNWGGYSFKPHEIEFWEGDKFRLNKRNLYKKNNTAWNHFILEP